MNFVQAIGKPFTLWCAFARFYERHNSIDNARIIFDKATAVAFKYVDDLASVWCEYAEMELRHQNYKNALNLLRQATAVPSSFDRRQVYSLSKGSSSESQKRHGASRVSFSITLITRCSLDPIAHLRSTAIWNLPKSSCHAQRSNACSLLALQAEDL